MCGDNAVFDAMRKKIAANDAEFRVASRSPWGPDDEIGMLNFVDDIDAAGLLARTTGQVYDLATEYFIGMPHWRDFGDQPYSIWMSHTPNGSVVDDVIGCGDEENHLVSYSGDSIMMYTHCGTHIDTFNHFGYNHEIWNGFKESEHLGSRHWDVCGADKHPPIITRGVLLDVAKANGTDLLPSGFAIGEEEIRETMKQQGTEIRPGDVVLIRTGRMTLWPDSDAFINDEPGINRSGAEFLSKQGAMIIGADNIALEVRPSEDPENFHVVHSYLLAEAGVVILEMACLEELARDEVHEFAFMGSCLKLRGSTGSPMRPVAMALQ